eukprot:s1799_g13.t1
MGCCASAATNAASAAVQLPSSLVSYFPSIDDFLKNSKAQLPVLGILRLDRKVLHLYVAEMKVEDGCELDGQVQQEQQQQHQLRQRQRQQRRQRQ